MALLASGLLPAAFRGVPFAVFADETGGGRRIALHQYPGRDEPWAEDMGRAARSFRFRGFIVDGDVAFVGGPIQLQRATLLAALERSGPGLLIHPTLGPVQVALVRFSMGADLGAGQLSTVDLEFVEAGKRTYPALLTRSTGLLTASNLLKLALAADAVRAIALAARAGGRRRDLANTAASWTSRVVALGADATALHRLTARLPGSFGRYASGGNQGVNGRSAAAPQTYAEAGAIAAAARVAIASGVSVLSQTISTGSLAYPVGLSDQVQVLVDALADACADPADQIRLLVQLLRFTSARAEATTDIGRAFGNAARRAVAARLAIATGSYQPRSSDDAAALILLIGTLLADIAAEAADAGDDESYRAIRATRAAIVEDLRTRGTTLARTRRVSLPTSVPSLTIAQRLYRDAGRAEQLEEQAQPVHPLFMPTTFEALTA